MRLLRKKREETPAISLEEALAGVDASNEKAVARAVSQFTQAAYSFKVHLKYDYELDPQMRLTDVREIIGAYETTSPKLRDLARPNFRSLSLFNLHPESIRLMPGRGTELEERMFNYYAIPKSISANMRRRDEFQEPPVVYMGHELCHAVEQTLLSCDFTGGNRRIFSDPSPQQLAMVSEWQALSSWKEDKRHSKWTCDPGKMSAALSSKYAQTDPSEDFCEHLTAAHDPAKRRIMEQDVPDKIAFFRKHGLID